MSNADGQFIPWVEDDQGEGIKDFVDDRNEFLKELFNSFPREEKTLQDYFRGK